MKAIILPGNSIANRDWAFGLKKEIETDFERIEILIYEHWDRGEKIIQFDKELQNLVNLTGDFDDYVILAKSVGTFLTVAGIKEKGLEPQGCIMMGTPLNWAGNIQFDAEKYFKDFDTKSLFIQQKDDLITKFYDLKKFLQDLQLTNYKLVEIEGNDHGYGDYNEIRNLILSFTQVL